jgi:hypothetical protein
MARSCYADRCKSSAPSLERDVSTASAPHPGAGNLPEGPHTPPHKTPSKLLDGSTQQPIPT